MQRVRYVGKALPQHTGKEGIVVDQLRVYLFVRFPDMHGGQVAINRENVVFL